MNSIYEAKIIFGSLTIYRALLSNKVIASLLLVFEELLGDNTRCDQFISRYGDFYNKLTEHNTEADFKSYLIETIIFDDNAFTRLCEKASYDSMAKNVLNAAERDLECLYKVASISSKDIKAAALSRFGQSGFEKDIIENLPEWTINNNLRAENIEIIKKVLACSNLKECVMVLADFYKRNGSGEFARYKGFVWERSGSDAQLRAVTDPDPIRFSDLIGYEMERQEVMDNTLQFLNGYPANNILLYGNRGTGKSSTIKALLNEYGHLGLRMVELPKTYLKDLTVILRIIKDRPQKFILFIDDLAFGDNEEEYTALKAVLEGGLESKPQNVIIYATSNRRHLIKERFSDRPGYISNDEDEVHAADTMQEKLSLADRFGITVTFSSPDKQRFLEIVEGLAQNRNLEIDKETLHKKALIWEMQYNGRSGRTARQFIDWLEGDRSKAHHE